MTVKPLNEVKRAIDTSAVVCFVRPVIAGSAVCVATASAIRWLRRTRGRIAAGRGGEWSSERALRIRRQLDAIASGSRIISEVSSWLTGSYGARRESRVTRVLNPILGLDLVGRVCMAGCMIAVAVITHTVLLAALGVPVHEIGWGIRAGVLLSSMVVARWPDTFAAAWIARTTRTENGPRS